MKFNSGPMISPCKFPKKKEFWYLQHLEQHKSIFTAPLNKSKEIESKLCVLHKQPLTDVGRASNLFWLNFGEKVVVTDRKGNDTLKGKYAINCSWRIIKENRIIVASKDIYIPKTSLNYDSFDWERYGENRFDEKIIELKEIINTSKILVSHVSADEIGSLKIDFNFGLKLELFPDDSLEEEFWRFIIFGDKSEHFVVFEK